MFDLGSVVAHFKADLTDFTRGIKTAKSQMSGLSKAGSQMASFGSSVARTAKRAVLALGAATAAITVFALKNASDYQQNAIAFETMLGSAEKAQVLLKEITTFAKKTPFELPGVVSSAKTLLAMGIEAQKVIPTLEAVGNAVAGTGADMERVIFNYGQVRTQTKLTGVELKDFLRNGIPLLGELAKNLNTTEADIKSMVETGQISFSDVEKAFQTMSGEGGRFENLMRKQSKSIGGMWSNIKDSVGIALTNIIGLSTETGEIIEGSFFDKINTKAEELMNWLEENQEMITEVSQTWITKFLDAGKKVIDVITKIVHWLKEHKNEVKIVAIGIGIFVAALLAAAAVAFIAANWIVFAVGLAVTIIAAQVAMAVNSWNKLKEQTAIAFAFVRDWITQTWQRIQEAWGNAVNWVVTTTTNTWEAIKNAFSTGVTSTINFFMKLPERIIFGIGWMVGRFIRFVMVDMPVFFIKTIMWFKLLPIRVEHFVKMTAIKFAVWMINLWQRAKEIVVNGFNAVVGWFQQLPGRIERFAVIMALRFMIKLIQFQHKITSWAQETVDKVVNFFRELPGRIVDAVQGGVGAVGGAIRSVGSKLLEGFKSGLGIPGFANGVHNFVGGLALVGEKGPELVNLPKGSDVIPNSQIGTTSSFTSLQDVAKSLQRAGSNYTVNNNIQINDEATLEVFRRQMHRDEIARKNGVANA